jgi:predicted permease
VATIREWLNRLWGTLRRTRADRDLEEELRLHLELAAEDARRRGDPPDRAARAARIEAGGLAHAMDELRDQRGLPWLEDLAHDLRYACRMLAGNPGFTIVSILSLTIGIGANCAVFSLADALLLRPLTVPRPAEVVTVGSIDRLWGTTPVGAGLVASYPDYVDLRDRARSFDGLAAFTNMTVAFGTSARSAPSLAGSDTLPRPRLGMLVSGNFFQAMRVEPRLGRAFLPEEGQVPGRDAVVVLGHDFWEQEFGADPSVVGRTVRLNGIEFTVIGVSPAGFTGLDQHVRFEFYAPLMMWPRLIAYSNVHPLDARDLRSVVIKGRLKPGVTIAQAQTELSVIASDLDRAYPVKSVTSRHQSLTVRTELENRIAQAPPNAMLIAMLTTLAGAVLLVACVNVAGLLTSRAPVRAREMALRLAIGAGRPRVIRQLMTESVLIAVIGGVLALGVGYAGVVLFRQIRFPTDLPIAPSFELDRRVLIVSLLTALASAIVFGLAPAFQATRAELIAVMKAADAAGPGRRRRWGRALLVSGQVAVSVVLLCVATFMYRGFRTQVDRGPGYRTDRVLTMTFEPSLVRYSETQSQQFFQQLVERARRAPGVTSAALASSVPMNGFIPLTIVPEGFRFPAGVENVTVSGAAVDEQYFDTIGLAILKGRAFGATDSAIAPKVAVVNEQLARTYWPGQDPLGKRFRLNDSLGPLVQIVGVAKTAKYTFLQEPPKSFAYLPYTQLPQRRMVLLAESQSDPASLAAPLRDVVRGLDANQPIANVRTMEEIYRMRTITILNVIIGLVAALGAMGLGLAIVGLYGLVAYAASRRTKEIGIRMAIGADRATVLRMVLRQGLALASAGLVVGLLASAGAARVLGAMFPGGSTREGRIDVVAFLLVASTVLAVTLVAAYVPARRASRVSLTEALRYE